MVHMRMWQTIFFYKRLWSVLLCVPSEGGLYNLMPVCLVCHCFVAYIAHRSDSSCVSRNHPWLPVDFQRIQHRQWSQPPPVLQKHPESRSKHDWMHRVGSWRWLKQAIACSDPPTDYNTIAMLMHFLVQIVWPFWLVAMVACGGCGLLLTSSQSRAVQFSLD